MGPGHCCYRGLEHKEKKIKAPSLNHMDNNVNYNMTLHVSCVELFVMYFYF